MSKKSTSDSGKSDNESNSKTSGSSDTTDNGELVDDVAVSESGEEAPEVSTDTESGEESTQKTASKKKKAESSTDTDEESSSSFDSGEEIAIRKKPASTKKKAASGKKKPASGKKKKQSSSGGETVDENGSVESGSEEEAFVERASKVDTSKITAKIALPAIDTSKVDPMEYTRFSNKKIRKIAEEKWENIKGKKTRKYGSLHLRPLQQLISDTFMATKDGDITCLQLGTGSGKTMIMFDAALRGEVSLLICPAAAMKDVTEQGINVGLIDLDDPKGSKILVFSESAAKKHTTYIREMKSMGKRKNLIILTSDTSIKTKKAKGVVYESVVKILERIVPQGTDFTVVIDEAHEEKPKIVSEVQILFRKGSKLPITRELLMSGSEIDIKEIGWLKKKNIESGAKLTIDNYIIVSETNKMPEEYWYWIESDPNPHKWSKMILKICNLPKNKFTKIAVCCANEDLKIVQDTLENQYIVYKPEMKGASTNFDNSKKAAYIFTHYKTTGLNVRAQCLFIVGGGTLRTERFVQATKRVVRPDNKTPKDKLRDVHIYAFYTDTDELMRLYYGFATSCPGWTYGRDPDVNSGAVHKAVALLRCMGSGIHKANRIDACIVVNNYVNLVKTNKFENMDEAREITLKWWKDSVKRSGIVSEINGDFIDNLIY